MQMIGGTDKRFLVVLADRHRGKYFTVSMDTFEDQGEEIIDNVRQNVRADTGHTHRHIREQLTKHLKHVGEKAREYLAKRNIKNLEGVIIGGHQELLNHIKDCLPSELRRNVIAEFKTELTLPVGDMTEKVKQCISAGMVAMK
jgi:peptide subunit release factor 1 (eRF1)